MNPNELQAVWQSVRQTFTGFLENHGPGWHHNVVLEQNVLTNAHQVVRFLREQDPNHRYRIYIHDSAPAKCVVTAFCLHDKIC
jgi:hypothetical protein